MFSPDKDLYFRYEMVTTILWFALDSSWLFEWRWAANSFAVAATLAAVLTVFHAERDAGSITVALGILGWVLMNAFWVTGDINKLSWAVTVAKYCAGWVLLCLVVALWVSGVRKEFVEVMGRFRRFRF